MRQFPPKHPCATCGKPASGKNCRSCYLRLVPRGRLGRPHYTKAERARRKAVVDDWIATHGYVCPGYQRPAHAIDPDTTKLTADHVVPYAVSGDEAGELSVLCQPCNSSKRDGRPARWTRRTRRGKAPAVRTSKPRSGVPAGDAKHVTVAEESVATEPHDWTVDARVPRRLTAVPDRSHVNDSPAEMLEPPPPAPDGAGECGREFWDKTLAKYELDEHELVQMRQLVRLIDHADELQRVIDREGVMVPLADTIGSKVNPALGAHRQLAIAIARGMAALRLPAGDEDDAQGLRRPQRRSGVRGVYSVGGTG